MNCRDFRGAKTNQTVTGTDTVTSTVSGTTGNIAVSPASASTLSVVASTGSTTAGSPMSVTVTARDQFGNAVTGYTGTVHFTSTDAQSVLPANYTFLPADNGAHTQLIS